MARYLTGTQCMIRKHVIEGVSGDVVVAIFSHTDEYTDEVLFEVTVRDDAYPLPGCTIGDWSQASVHGTEAAARSAFDVECLDWARLSTQDRRITLSQVLESEYGQRRLQGILSELHTKGAAA